MSFEEHREHHIEQTSSIMPSTIVILALILCFHHVVGDFKDNWVNLATRYQEQMYWTTLDIKDLDGNAISSFRMVGRSDDRSTTTKCWHDSYWWNTNGNTMYCAAKASCLCNAQQCERTSPYPERCRCETNYHGLYNRVDGYSCCKNDGSVVVKIDGKDETEQCCRSDVSQGLDGEVSSNVKAGCNTDHRCCDWKNGYKTIITASTASTASTIEVTNQVNRGNGVATHCKDKFKVPTCTACEDGWYTHNGWKCEQEKIDGKKCGGPIECVSNICKGLDGTTKYCCNNLGGKQCNECGSNGQCSECQGKDYGMIPSSDGICNKCESSFYFTTTVELGAFVLPGDDNTEGTLFSTYCAKRKDDGEICSNDRMCKKINDKIVPDRCKNHCCKSDVPITGNEHSKCTTCNENGLCETCDKNGRGPLCEYCQDGFYKNDGVCLERKDPGSSCSEPEQCKSDTGTCDTGSLATALAIQAQTNRLLSAKTKQPASRQLTTTKTSSKCAYLINSKSDCDSLAVANGDANGSTEEDVSDFPKGCYLYTGTRFYFNTHSTGSDCTANNKCYCAAAPPATCMSFTCNINDSNYMDSWIKKNNAANLDCVSDPCTSTNDKTACCNKLPFADAVALNYANLYPTADAQCNAFYGALMQPMQLSTTPASETLPSSFQKSMCNGCDSNNNGCTSCIDRFVAASSTIEPCYLDAPALQLAFNRIANECDIPISSYPKVSGINKYVGVCQGNRCCSASAVLQSSCDSCRATDGKCKKCGSVLPDSSGKCLESCVGSAKKTVYKEFAPVGEKCEGLVFTRACATSTGSGQWGDYSNSDGTLISKYSDSCNDGCTKSDTGLEAAHNEYIIFDRFKENEVNPGQQCEMQHLQMKCNNGVFENAENSLNNANTDIFGAKSCSVRW